jgi:hypothetical protein
MRTGVFERVIAGRGVVFDFDGDNRLIGRDDPRLQDLAKRTTVSTSETQVGPSQLELRINRKVPPLVLSDEEFAALAKP